MSLPIGLHSATDPPSAPANGDGSLDPPSIPANGEGSGRAEARVGLHTAAAVALGGGGGGGATGVGRRAGDGVRGAGAVHPRLVRDHLPQGVLLLYLEDVGLLS